MFFYEVIQYLSERILQIYNNFSISAIIFRKNNKKHSDQAFLASTATAEATTKAASAAATSEATTIASLTATLAVTFAATIRGTAKEIQTIADVEHSVRSNSIDFAVGPAISIDRTTEIGLFTQDIVPLQHDCKLLATQEAIRELRVPDELVGVQRGIGIAALAVDVEVG
jgi:hypothetical protein